jgi:hypothetical protein
MGDVIDLDDGYGRRIGEAWPMPARPGAHSVYARGSDLVVEWYDFGDHAPYESANMVIFDRPAQARLAQALEITPLPSPDDLSETISHRFDSYFDVKQFAEETGIPFAAEVDFQP